MANSWKLTLPCTKAEAERIAAAEIDGVVLVCTEEDEASSAWRLDAYFDGQPPREAVAAIRELAASSGWSRAQPEPLADHDWVTLSQAGLEPICAGRFVVHTSAHPTEPPTGGRAFLIEAGQAFGTGHHETTAGCLAMLDALADRGFENVIDLGTGTGLLAFAARHLWPDARVVATDIDPVAVEVTRENLAANAIGAIDLIVADGARDPAIAAGAPYDLVVANILAGPLIAMAPEVSEIAARGTTIVLAGLLNGQAGDVIAAYEAEGCVLAEQVDRGDWSILRLDAVDARRGAGWAASAGGDRNAWANDGTGQ